MRRLCKTKHFPFMDTSLLAFNLQRLSEVQGTYQLGGLPFSYFFDTLLFLSMIVSSLLVASGRKKSLDWRLFGQRCLARERKFMGICRLTAIKHPRKARFALPASGPPFQIMWSMDFQFIWQGRRCIIHTRLAYRIMHMLPTSTEWHPLWALYTFD